MENLSAELRLQGIAQLLATKNLLTQSKLLVYQHQALANQQSLIDYLINNQLIASASLAQVVAEHFALPLMDLDKIDVATIPLELVNEQFIRRYAILPLYVRDKDLVVATADPSNQNGFKEMQFHTGLSIKTVIVESDKLYKLIDKLLAAEENQHLLDYLANTNEKNHEMSSFAVNEEEAPVIKFVNQILLNAIKKGASDIHFEPYDHEYRIRYRQDGILREIANPPLNLAPQISARIKVMANLDIAERRMPQDGRLQMRVSEHHVVDCRISSCPTIGGEKVVVRILDTDLTRLNMNYLGLDEIQKRHFIEGINKPQGLILVTGPTGSGKTVSLYTALTHLNSSAKNISTVEDPVEIKLLGINQVNINPKIGLTFSHVLRSFLRQDPDIIMVGEIRDLETAEIAIKAAQTGHLVLATLHTNSASETLTRLINLGVPVFNLANSITLLVAQRLARLLCNHCKTEQKDLSVHELFTSNGNEHEANAVRLYQAVGCEHCIHGYQGRLGLFEVMPISKNLSQHIINGASAVEIEQLARSQGVSSIYQSGLAKVKEGLTTLEEINRVMID